MLNKPKKTEFLGIRCTKETIEKLQEIAEKEERTLSYIANKALEEFIEK